jgi:hypothetical protein
MPETRDASGGRLAPAQAAELALLIDLEARWQNLRTLRSPSVAMPSASQQLHDKQKAYETFRAKLRSYNTRYAPQHVPEVLLNTPARLGSWCRRMRDLFRVVEHDARVGYPVHLLEKAYRCANWLAGKVSRDPISRSAPPGTIPGALRELEALAEWCDHSGRAS